jgi:hypothetical protein
MRDRALRPELSQRDCDRVSRAADYLRQRFMCDWQRRLLRLVSRDQKPLRQALAARMDPVAGCGNGRLANPTADVHQRDTSEIFGVREDAQQSIDADQVTLWAHVDHLSSGAPPWLFGQPWICRGKTT